jgi:hypothetical protein
VGSGGRLAGEEGIYRTARTLHLDYPTLRKRVEPTTNKRAVVLPSNVVTTTGRKRKSKSTTHRRAPAAAQGKRGSQ